MANTISSRLTFSFDTTKFGGAYYLSQEAKNSMNVYPSDVVQWQTQEIANGTISPSNYFKNPVQGVCSSITSNTNSIITFCTNDVAKRLSQITGIVEPVILNEEEANVL